MTWNSAQFQRKLWGWLASGRTLVFLNLSIILILLLFPKLLPQYLALFATCLFSINAGVIYSISYAYKQVRRIKGEKVELEDRLLRSQKMEGMGQLAGGVAHDFNNILSVILNFSDFVKESLGRDHPAISDLDEIRKAALRGTALTRQILIFSRKAITKPEIVDVRQSLEQMKDFLKRLLREDIDFQIHLPDNLWKMEIDPNQFEMVMMNVVANARDAMPKNGKLTIEVCNTELAAASSHHRISVIPGKYVQINISDTGCGMSQEVMAQIFEPFYTTKPSDKGTGLGLSTVYSILKRAKGNIWVYSEPNLGTIFKLYVPATDKELYAPLSTGSEKNISLGTLETILVVEDDDAVRQTIVRTLRSHNYNAIEARNGPEAISIFKQTLGEIKLLLTDVVMPQMSGSELAEKLKASYPNLKVLYSSGYSDDIIRYHGILDSQAELIQKPYNHETLLKKVRESLF